ncbi:MAG: hypothetical protein ABIK65_02500 [Candidatus Eisenbacteria bacterium]
MIVLLLAAALLAAGLVVALLRLTPPGAPAARRVSIEPSGAVRAPMEFFVWRRLEGAERFRLELTARDGSLLWTATTTDTILQAPRGLEFDPTRIYRWRITSTFADGLTLAADEETFQVLPPPGRDR